jgi:hypothetical protein
MNQNIDRFLDKDGKVKLVPAKQMMREFVFAYLATKFNPDQQYTEREVNEILSEWHTFNDYFILRRGLIESQYLQRKSDGSCYWINKEKLKEPN